MIELYKIKELETGVEYDDIYTSEEEATEQIKKYEEDDGSDRKITYIIKDYMKKYSVCFKHSGELWEILETRENNYVLDGWNGEQWTKSAIIDSDYNIIKDNIAIKPVFDCSDEDDIKIIDFKID